MVEDRVSGEKNRTVWYEPAGFFLLRAPHLPAQLFLQLTVAGPTYEPLPGDQLDVWLSKRCQQSYAALAQLIEDPGVEQALLVASGSLAAGIACIRSGDRTSRRAKQAFASIFRYLVRMCTRPTPFGLFSGIAVGTLDKATTTQLFTPSLARMRTRPDMGWLLSLVQQVEEDQEVLPHLPVQMNCAVYLAGTRAVLPSTDVYGKGDNRSVAARATPVFQYIQEVAQKPLPYQVLHQEVCQAFSYATEAQVERFLRQLWESHFLISDLRPPLTSANPERYLLERLRKLPGTESLVQALNEILRLASTIDSAGIGGPTAPLIYLAEKQQTLVREQKDQSYQIDAVLALAQTQLTVEVGTAGADAAEALLRLGRAYTSPHLREYHRLFVERYGVYAEVPLLDLLSPELGLDAPSTYLEPPRALPLAGHVPSRYEQQERRERLLCDLLATALHERAEEIELTDTLLEQLTQWQPDSGHLPLPAVDLYLQLHAPSREALDQGNWRGVVAPATLTLGGRTFGRFFDLLDAQDIHRLEEYARQEEACFPDVLFAEVSYLPKQGRGANVAIRPLSRRYEIVLNTTPSVPPERVIALSDLVVGIEQEGFYVRSLTHGKRVVATQSHLLNWVRAPNVCRFLLEVSRDAFPSLSAFNWGPVAHAPFLPRVVRKKIVLKPAQWNLRPSMVEPSGIGSEKARFFAGIQQWRQRWRVPRYVYLQESDQRLLLDLEHPLSVAEVQHRMQNATLDTTLSLQEMLPNFEYLWLRDGHDRGYLSEVVIPLRLNSSTLASRLREPLPVEQEQDVDRYPIPDRERLQLPGEDWVFLKLYASAKQHEEVIGGPLREVIERLRQQQVCDRWFFIRYADPEPHLRVRFHAANEAARNELLIKALAWGRELVEVGLIRTLVLDTYSREVERYGGPQAIDALEELFSIDSGGVAETVAALGTGQVTLDAQTVNILTLDQLFASWGWDRPQRLEYLQARTGKYEQSERFRSQRRLLSELLDPWDPDFDPAIQVQRALILHCYEIPQCRIQRIAAQIHELARQGALWVSEESLLASLAHMHLNRLQGIDREQEQATYALWRQTLESIQRRPVHKKEGDAAHAQTH